MKTIQLGRPTKSRLSFIILLSLLLVSPLQAQVFDITILEPDGAEYNAQAIVNGNPAISYNDITNGVPNGVLKFVRANDPTGSTWGTPVIIDTGGVGAELSMQVIDGNPAIAYRDRISLRLKYVRATDPNGTAWGNPVVVDSAGNVGIYPSLATVNGKPAICYYDITNENLKFVRALDSTGATWGVPAIIVANVSATSLKIVNGNPAITYSDPNTPHGLVYLRASDPNGMTWGAPVIVDGNGSNGLGVLEIVNGNPAIGYHNVTNNDVRYVRAADENGVQWNAPVTVSGPGDEAREYVALAVVNGKPAIAYKKYNPRNLRYVSATDANGTTWGAPVAVESTNSPLYFLSMVDANGNPSIGYVMDGVLKVAIGAEGLPVSVGNISTRLAVGTGDNALIGGFIITGNQPKRIIIRAIGPSLPVPDVLADPILEFHQSDGTVITNDNWRSTQESEIIATGVQPSDDLEAAVVVTLPPGGHTAIVRGTNNTTGVGLVELYDLDTGTDSKMANVSTRGLVRTGNNVLIGGTIITGTGSLNVLVRGIGPSLTTFGVPNALGDPTLDLYDSNGAVIASNDQWQETQQVEIQATGLAPTNNLESAILRTLTPGAYTAIVRGKNDTTGVGVVEVYALQSAF